MRAESGYLSYLIDIEVSSEQRMLFDRHTCYLNTELIYDLKVNIVICL